MLKILTIFDHDFDVSRVLQWYSVNISLDTLHFG